MHTACQYKNKLWEKQSYKTASEALSAPIRAEASVIGKQEGIQQPDFFLKSDVQIKWAPRQVETYGLSNPTLKWLRD